MKKKKVTIILILSLILLPLMNSSSISSSPQLIQSEPRNIILMIGDGMGFEHIDLGRLTEIGVGNLFNFETFPFHANISTDALSNYAGCSCPVTDSAAAGTAMATGFKTNREYVSVLPNGSQVKTILEYSHEANLSTGLVTTTEMTHATPATFASHVIDRDYYSDIAQFYADNGTVDIFLGGGDRRFTDPLKTTFTSNGYTLLANRNDLVTTTESKLLGLFTYSHFPYELSRDETLVPSLAEMTQKSLSTLSNDPDGFFLMIEGGKIDLGSHDNDKVEAVLEMIEFVEAIQVAYEFAQNTPNTLLIVTADHETGGLEIVEPYLDNSILPASAASEQEAENIRLDRVSKTNVTWSTDYHTNSSVGLWGFGSDFYGFTNNSAMENTEVFNILYTYLQEPASMKNPPSSTLITSSSSTTQVTSSSTSDLGSNSANSSSSQPSNSSGFVFLMLLFPVVTLAIERRMKRN